MAITAATSCAWYITRSIGRTIWVSDISVGIQCRLNCFRVSPVITAATPGTLRAAVESIFVIFACAYGLRTMSRCSMPGREKSST